MSMDEPEKRIAELQSKTEQTNYEFVKTELASCFSAIENGIRALESGDRESAQDECDKAEKGYKTIVGFVADVGDEGPRAEVEKLWNAVRTRLDALQSMLKDSGPQ
jgi:hypothetical protein